MPQTLNLEALIQDMATKAGKTEEEVSTMVQEKISKFSGLLTEQGAAFLVQKELGLAQENYEQIQIGRLEKGMKGIEIKGIVESVYPVKEFEKSGKKGKLQSFIISDESGEVRATLWNDQVDEYKLTRGSEVLLSNVLVTEYNEKKQITLGFKGNAKILNKKEETFEKISELKAGINGANVIGRIIRKFPAKEFESKERKGKLCSFQIGDETAIIRATAWNEKAGEIEKFNEGDTIEIKNAYTKEGMYGPELHLGYTAAINESTVAVPAVNKILKEKLTQKQITQLNEGENALIRAKILGVERGKFLFEVCAKCGKKVTKTEVAVLCENCGETTTRKNAVVSLTVKDESGEIRANFFGNTALKALGMEQTQLETLVEQKTSDIIAAELNAKLEGKEIAIYGYEKISSFSGNKEFSAREIVEN